MEVIDKAALLEIADRIVTYRDAREMPHWEGWKTLTVLVADLRKLIDPEHFR